MKHSYVRATLNQETNTIRMILARAMAVAATTKRVAMTLLLAVLTTATAWADEDLGDWRYKFNNARTQCIITAYLGNKSVTFLVIPKVYRAENSNENIPVIDVTATFTDCPNLKTLYFFEDTQIQGMPDMQGCTNFKEIHLCTSYNENNAIGINRMGTITSTDNTLPSSMTNIYNSFRGTNIETLNMPNVTSIGNRAFEGCNSLTSVTFGQAVSIDAYSNSFSKIDSKCTVTYPGPMANWSCYNYQYSPNLVINCTDGSCGWCGDGWSSGMELYQNASCLYWTLDNSGNLTIDCVPQDIIYNNYLSKQIIRTQKWNKAKVKSLTLKNVYSFNDNPFQGHTNLTTIVVDSNNPIYDSRDGCNAIIKTATKTLVVGCKNTSIPSSVTAIGNQAFAGCTGLTSFTIPNSVTAIGNSAFEGCTGLSTITIPNSVTTIGNSSFKVCTRLTYITIPNSVTYIGANVFLGCTGLSTITIPNSVTYLGDGVFSGCTGLTTITISNNVGGIGNSAFEGCTGLTTITIPNSVTTIGANAFEGCTGLTTITIPNSVTDICGHAFEGCTRLTFVSIPNSVTDIYNHVFNGCTRLTSVTIPNSVTYIRMSVFGGCTGLTSIIIPSSVTYIEQDAFVDCSSLTDIYYDGTPEQWDQVTKESHWIGDELSYQVYYPAAVTTTAATEVEIPYGQEWTDIPVTVSSLNLGWFQNEGKPGHRADAVAVTPFVGSGASSAFTFYDGQRTIDASKGAGEHTVGNRVSEPLTAVGQSGTLWVHIPKTTWDAATAGSYTQTLPYDAVFLYNGASPVETYTLDGAMVTVRLTVPEAVTLTFDANGGSGDAMDAVSGRPGLTITLPTCTYTAPTDKTFLSWNTKANGTGRRYYPGDDFTVNMTTTLYAEWGGECEIDLTDVSEKVITQDEWGLLSMLHGYFYYGDDGPLFDVNLDGKADLELLRPEYNSELDDYVGDYAVRKLAEAANLSGSYRFLLPPKNSEYEEESGSIVIIFGSGATVQQPAIELLYDNNGTYNSEKLLTLKDGQLHNLMLSERTLYRDGYWNTLCLPFNVSDFTNTPLEGFTVKELDTETAYNGHVTGLEGSTLYLNFKDATSIEAGKPYIVKKMMNEYVPHSCIATSGTAGAYIDLNWGYENLVDGSTTTYWRPAFSGSVFCEFHADKPRQATSYTLTTGNANTNHNFSPAAWTLKAKVNEGDPWTTIDSRDTDDAMPDINHYTKTFTIQHPGTYKYYRFEVTQTTGGERICLSELTLQELQESTNLTNPVFCGVTVTAQAKDIPNPYRYSYDDPEYITVAVPGSVSFTGGKFCGTYDPTDIYDDEHDKFYLGNNNKLYWPETDGYSVKAFRAYFDLSSAPAGVREFHLSFGEDDATGIVSTTNLTNYTNSAGAGWYDLSGRKLSGKPTKKGLYINNGRKVVIK